jgi:hypothetical protein
VNTLFFLNSFQRKILEDNDIELKSLNKETLKNTLSSEAYFKINNLTSILLTKGNLLNKLGFIDSSDSKMVVYSTELSDLANEINNDNLILKAVCTSPDTMITWQSDIRCNDANVMITQSIINILEAMSAAYSLEKIKESKQFELCLLSKTL